MIIHALLLAAGQSKRFGDIKQLTRVGPQAAVNVKGASNLPNSDNNTPNSNDTSKTMIEAVSEQYCHANFDAVRCVLGSNAEKIESLLAPTVGKVYKLTTTVAEHWQLGMGASIAHGMSVLPKHVSHVCIGLSDQVAITCLHLNKLILAAQEHPEMIIASHFNSSRGAPCIFPAQFFPQLAALIEDIGARNIIRQYPHKVVNVNMPQAAIDIDTKQDLQRYLLNT